MKKMVLIAILLVVCTTGMASAADDFWAVFAIADNGNGMYSGAPFRIGVLPHVSAIAPYDSDIGSVCAWVVAESEGITYSKLSYPSSNGQPLSWRLFVAADTYYPGSTIRLRLNTHTDSAILPPQANYTLTFVSGGGQYAPGTSWRWDSFTTNQCFHEMTLPTIKTDLCDETMIANGYEFTFTYDPVPEPTGMMALGTGLVSLAGLALRRRLA